MCDREFVYILIDGAHCAFAYVVLMDMHRSF